MVGERKVKRNIKTNKGDSKKNELGESGELCCGSRCTAEHTPARALISTHAHSWEADKLTIFTTVAGYELLFGDT